MEDKNPLPKGIIFSKTILLGIEFIDKGGVKTFVPYTPNDEKLSK